jgi:peptidoglycan/xylan/chitin deacetylase (PgdA/CDA1 family)
MGIPRATRTGAAPVAKRALLVSGFYSGLRRILPSRQLAILRYHAICAPDAGYADAGICISPQAFEQHLEYLAAHYRVLPLPDAVAYLRQGRTLPANAVAVTFDDGYADNLAAARGLAKFGLTATFYITAGCLAGEAPFWPAEIRELVRRMPGPAVDLTSSGEPIRLALGTPAERQAAVRTLTKLFKRHRIAVREAWREELRAHAGVSGVPSPMLTWADVRDMHRLGMTIGSHTMTHPNLPNAGAVDAQREITMSKSTLEGAIGEPVTMFSYPNGGADRYMTREIATLVRDAGFAAATTSRNAFAGPRSDLFALERVHVSENLEDLVFALEVERFAFKPAPRAGEVQ